MGLPVRGEIGSAIHLIKENFLLPENRKKHTEGSTLGNGLLAATTTNADAVDDIALLGLVSEAAGLVGTAGTRSPVDDVQLTKLY